MSTSTGTDGNDLYFSSDGNIYDASGTQVGSYHSDDHGHIDQTATDTNGDNKIDLVLVDNDHNGVLETASADIDYDGHADVILVDADQNGSFETVLPDADGDGVPDTDHGVPDHAAV